jgi:hypothetical protein
MEFTALANRSTGLTPEALLDYFISGLNKDLRREVISQNPTTMVQAVAVAHLFEDKFCTTQKPSTTTHPRSSYSKPTTNTPPPKKPPLLPTPSTKPFHSPIQNRTIKSITPAEMQLRREKGMCYYCDDKFSPQHRCPNKRFMLLQLGDVESLDLELDLSDSTTFMLEPTTDVIDHHLSLNAMNGCSSLGTLRFT